MRDISQGTHQQMTSYILFSMWYYLYISCRAFAMGGIGKKKDRWEGGAGAGAGDLLTSRILRVRMRLKEIEIVIENGKKGDPLMDKIVIGEIKNEKGRENNTRMKRLWNSLTI